MDFVTGLCMLWLIYEGFCEVPCDGYCDGFCDRFYEGFCDPFVIGFWMDLMMEAIYLKWILYPIFYTSKAFTLGVNIFKILRKIGLFSPIYSSAKESKSCHSILRTMTYHQQTIVKRKTVKTFLHVAKMHPKNQHKIF